MAAAICPFLADQSVVGPPTHTLGMATPDSSARSGSSQRFTAAVYSGWSPDSEQEEPVSILSRAFGVQPATRTRCGFNGIW